MRQTLKIATTPKYGVNGYGQSVPCGVTGGQSGGVDIFIDSVGGVFHSIVLEHMKFGGRVCILGTLAQYGNPNNVPMVPATDLAISLKVIPDFIICAITMHIYMSANCILCYMTY